MKLYARTPAGTGLIIDISFTGRVKESSDKISSVEISLPAGCDYVYGVVQTKTPSGRLLLWVDSGDVCANDGATATQEELRAEVERVNDQQRADMMRGPLGDNWP